MGRTVTLPQEYQRPFILQTWRAAGCPTFTPWAEIVSRLLSRKEQRPVTITNRTLLGRTQREAKAGGHTLTELREMWTETTPEDGLDVYEWAEKGRQEWAQVRARLAATGRWARLAFLADMQHPFQDDAAIDLALQIVGDFDPDIVTGLNDFFQFEPYSSWEQASSIFDRLWEGELRNPIARHREVMARMHKAAPNAAFVGLPGNHDLRLFRFLRKNVPFTAEFTLGMFIEKLVSHGLIWLGEDNLVVELSPGLAIMHGRYHSKNVQTALRNTLMMFGYQRSVIVGHIHRIGYFVQQGHDFDVEAQSSGCLCRVKAPYDPYPRDWHTGIVLGVYDPNGRGVQTYNIKFIRQGGGLLAFWGGKEYRA